jgi:MYXO-CTERM domain-containing protein
MKRIAMLTAIAAAGLALGTTANAAAVRTNAGFNSNTLAPNDDGSTGFVSFGFSGAVNFFGVNYTGGWVNNNGNLTFDSPLSTFTPFNILTTGRPMLAPFFADVDTRAAGDPVRYGTSTVDGHDAFGVNWVNVDFFSSNPAHTERNSFQLVVIDRSDRGAGDFDFEFNYDCIEWEAGQASGGNSDGDWIGPGGGPARAGWSNGVLDAFEIAGSGVDNAFLSSTGDCLDGFLVANSLNSNVAGRWRFSVVNGMVMPPMIPLPTGGAMGLAGVLVLAARRRRAD